MTMEPPICGSLISIKFGEESGIIWDSLEQKQHRDFQLFVTCPAKKLKKFMYWTWLNQVIRDTFFFFAAKTGHEFQHLQVAATTLTYYLMVKLLWFLDVSGEDFPVKTDELNSCWLFLKSSTAYEASMSTLMGEFEWYVQMAGREFLGGTETRISLTKFLGNSWGIVFECNHHGGIFMGIYWDIEPTTPNLGVSAV